MQQNSQLELAIDACADRLDYLNETFSALATEQTREGVLLWREYRARLQRGPIEEPVEQTPAQPAIDLQQIAIELLTQHSFEDVLDKLAADYGSQLSPHELVHLVGRREYITALKRELDELLKNAISFEQIASLWNDLQRPSFGASTWSSGAISLLAS